jgi:opacity protein-like surface antigen
MKRSAIAILTALVLLSTGATVFAAGSNTGDLEVDGSFALATGPGSFDSGWGVNAGVGYMLNDVVKNLQARVDIGYYDFSTDFFFTSLDFTRVPITVSARYYFPISDQLKVFAQAGVEASADSKEFIDVFGFKETKNELNVGLSPGAGVEFWINPQISVYVLGRSHLITDSYITMHFGAAFYF